jgi:hypothetical protein
VVLQFCELSDKWELTIPKLPLSTMWFQWEITSTKKDIKSLLDGYLLDDWKSVNFTDFGSQQNDWNFLFKWLKYI